MLKPLILAEYLVNGVRLLRLLAEEHGLPAQCLLCPPRAVLRARFLAAQALHAALLPLRDKRFLAGMALRGRIHIRGAPLHAKSTLSWIRRRGFDVGLHATGVIYRQPLLDCFRLGVLNAHIGLLPEYRGRSVMEWSILRGDPTGITTFFIDEGVDTGPRMVLREPVDVTGAPDALAAKNRLFALDGEMYAKALRKLAEDESRIELQRLEDGRRYYVMSSLLQGVVNSLLRSAADGVPSA